MRKSSALYDVEFRQLGATTTFRVSCQRGEHCCKSAEKVLPPIFELDLDGSCRRVYPEDLLDEVEPHRYYSGSKEFPPERIADLEVSRLYGHFLKFPTMEQTILNGESLPHPIAEEYYSNLVCVRLTEPAATSLRKLSYEDRTEVLAFLLDSVRGRMEDSLERRIDFHSVPKHEVGKQAFLADSDGHSIIGKLMSFGWHRCIPTDRIARESASVKGAERFSLPNHGSFDVPSWMKPFVTVLRIGVIGTEFSMLDSADLFESGVRKVACNIEKVHRLGDIDRIPEDLWNLELKATRAGIDIVHVHREVYDEATSGMGPVRLVLPGGVKIAAQPQYDSQAYDEAGRPIDAFVAFETLAKKGALALFLMKDYQPSDVQNFESAWNLFESLSTQRILYRATEYDGYVLEVPVFRPAQRWLDLCKPTRKISFDMISHAILNLPMKVPERVEKEYNALVRCRREVKQIVDYLATR